MEKMKIVILNPPFLNRFSREQRSPAVTKSGTLYYPMWLAYATALLEEHGYKVKLIDCPASGAGWKGVKELIGTFQPQLTVIDTSTPSIYNDIGYAQKIKKLFPDTYIVMVGPHVSALPEDTLTFDDCIDAIAIGEYDSTILDVARVLEEGGEPKDIEGLVVRKNGEIIRTGERYPLYDLDSLPFASKAYKKHLNYRNYFYAHSRYPIVAIVTARGCPHRCIYCVYPQVFSGRKVRFRSIPNVVDEIEYILDTFPGLKEIMFEDDTFTLNKKRCFEFSEEVCRRRIKFQWSANSRADLDFETMYVLKQAGARLFCVGIESGCQHILDNMKKNLKVERIRRFFRDAKRAGILIHGCFLVGNPGETKETLATTLQFAKELNPDTAQFFPIMVYPGTEAYKWAIEKNYLTSNNFREWLTPEGLHNCVISRPGLSNYDLVDFCDTARQRFYLRPSYITKKFLQGISDSQEMKRLAKGALKLSVHIMKKSLGAKRGKY